jgi:hemoglobin/transferrin/lactoferrin receptor protein
MHLFRIAATALSVVLLVTPVAYAFLSVHGVVRDSSGAAVRDAEILIATPERASVATARSDAEGRFQIDVPVPGRYLLVVSSPGFKEARQSLTIVDPGMKPVDIVLHVAVVEEDVTVTASPGVVQDVRTAGQPVNVIDAREILERVDTVVAEAVSGEAGVQLQRTSPTMAGVFVRGLTGNKVNVFVDGIRYSNGAQRGGVNTFLDLIEPGMLEGIEVLRGPSSAQYGSDALGGSIQFLTRIPSVSATGRARWGGSFALSGGTGHRHGGAEAFGSYGGRSVGFTMSRTRPSRASLASARIC